MATVAELVLDVNNRKLPFFVRKRSWIPAASREIINWQLDPAGILYDYTDHLNGTAFNTTLLKRLPGSDWERCNPDGSPLMSPTSITTKDVFNGKKYSIEAWQRAYVSEIGAWNWPVINPPPTEELVPEKPRKRSCYGGHDWLDTGTRKVFCKNCDVSGSLDPMTGHVEVLPLVED